MKKILMLASVFVVTICGLMFGLPIIKQINDLPNNMVVTYEDVTQANEKDIYSPLINLSLPKNIDVSNNDLTDAKLKIKLFNLITIKTIDVKLLSNSDVYVGGNMVGFCLTGQGVIYVGSNPIVTPNGTKEPILDSDLQTGDNIIKINGIEIKEIQDIDRIINLPNFAGNKIELTILRDGEIKSVGLLPVYDCLTQKYKLGIWVRNSASGVGTLTYIKQNDFRFGAIGHPIVDASLGDNFNVASGNLYKCKLVDIKRGEKNNPGEFHSSIDLSEDSIGVADTNCDYGVFGNILNKSIIDASRTAKLGGRLAVSVGDAYIYCSLDGKEVKPYSIKILKTNNQDSASDKSMVIKVTDQGLLKETGGIVQGMSGSPIVQNGKIIGAVTHVFLNDPTRGYGVYIDWMVDR